MFRKYFLTKLELSLLILFLVMGIAVFFTSKIKFLDDFKQRISGHKMPSAKNFGKAEVFIEPTKYPWILRKHLSDFTLSDNESIDILKLYPKNIHLLQSIANNTYRQFTLGEDGFCYELTIEWKTGLPVEIKLFDRLERPIAHYGGSFGKEKLNVFGSVYKMQLVYNGVIPKDSAIIFHSERLEQKPENILGVKEAFKEIPRIKIVFDVNSIKGLENLRKDSKRRLIALGATGNPIETINKKVFAQLYYSPAEKSDIRIWQSGQGQITHFDERSPSFTAKIVSGPLFYGICSFKLYTIKSQQGLLDYTFSHLADNEGLFVPRKILVDVTINESHAGLYLLEELPSPEFFAGKSQYDGFIQSMGVDYFKPAITTEAFDTLNIDTMLKSIDSDKFSKTLALFSRFQGVHGLGESNMRFYLNPILRNYEPLIRDVNVGIWDGTKSCGVRELLTYTNFWMGERPFADGSHYNIKTLDFKSSAPLAHQGEAYTWTMTTLGLSNIQPIVPYFINIPRFREMFEGYLFYYSGGYMEQSFLNTLSNSFDVAGDFLRDEEEYYKAISYQTKKQYKDDPLTMAQFVYPLLKKSRVLAIPYNFDENGTIYALLNLSTFSLRIKKESLPEYCEIIDKDIDINDNGYFMAPSKFFAMSINNLYNLNDEFTLDKLTQKSIKKILNIEFRSYLRKYISENVYVGPQPFLRVKIPQGKEEEFEKNIAGANMFKVADGSFLNKNQIKFLKDFDLDKPKKIIVNINKNAGENLLPMNTEENLLIQNIGQYPIAGGYLIRYLFLNQSSRRVDIDFDKSGDPRIKQAKASLIGNDGIKNAASHFSLAPMKKGEFTKTTNLWIDNFIPLFNGTQADDDSNVALADLYFNITNLNRERAVFSMCMVNKIASFRPGYLYNSISYDEVVSPAGIFTDSFEEWISSSEGYLAPKDYIYFQEGSGGAVEKCESKENTKDGKTSILLKPSSQGASYVRYQFPDIEALNDRTIEFSVWVKSRNKSPDAIQVDIQDGAETLLIVSYPNSGEWELLTIRKYVPKNAKFILLTYNIKNAADAPVYFDNAAMIYSEDQFRLTDSFEDWIDSPDGYSLPRNCSYFQEGSGGAVEKAEAKENIKDGKASILVKPSSKGASYVRYQFPDIEKIRGRNIKFSIWVKSENKALEAIQIDVQDGVGPVRIIPYHNSGKWELCEIKKYVSEDAKFLLLTLNVTPAATAPAYFDNAMVVCSEDQFKVKIHEPFGVPTLPHDLLGEGKIDRPIVKIEDNQGRQKETIYFKDNICNDILTVKENQTLVLKPGQVIRFSENAGIIVYGQIFAKGKKDKKIELLPQKDKWLGLLVINNNETDKINYLSNCRIAGASGLKAKFYNPFGGLSFIQTNVILKDIDIENFSSEDSIHFYKSNFKIVGMRLSGGVGDGIDSDWSYGAITKSYFNSCAGDCLDISGSLAEISYNSMVKAGDKGISVGEGSMALVSNNKLEENTIGIAVKDQSIIAGEGNIFRKNTTAAIALYIKKANYIPPKAALSGSEFYENKKNILNANFDKVTREYDK